MAKCFCSELEALAEAQIRAVCDAQVFCESKIRIMPDVHAGKGCTIGTTMTIKDKVVPGMVGVDIGCGMLTIQLRESSIDFGKLDELIRNKIPFGREVRKEIHPLISEVDIEGIRCPEVTRIQYLKKGLGSLGGGNHFIEVDKDDKGTLYLVIHSGSRYLGKTVAEYYQNEGYRILCGNSQKQIDAKILELKAAGRFSEIQSTIETMKANEITSVPVPKELAFVEGELFEDYIHDMIIVQRYAELNRRAMAQIIIDGLSLHSEDEFTTVHNYIDTDNMILRKGSVSAQKGEKLLIPINMRDGSLICIGKGNPDWNYSAPHGAGRLMSRRTAFNLLSMEEFISSMEGIYTTCVQPETLDESPMAYKTMDDIVANITPTAEIQKIIKPVYNFKASE